MEFVSATCQALLVLVFGTAVFGKARSATSFAAFREAVVTLGRVPAARAGALAAGIVSAEAVIVVLLAVPWPPGVSLPRSIGLPAAIGLLCSFTFAIVRARRGGETVSCRCFGTSAGPLGRVQLLRNALLIAAATAALPGTAHTGHLSWQAHFAAWLCGFTVALVLVVGDELAALLRRRPHPVSPAHVNL
ncbi:MauE/DoxX family redox-associated membrane protein [Streptomyces sp. NPDC002889]|uniref:MauE/DoxX family redox-associated membrane protein n=1 Tax=Streptomyces sp. NPDC002889 TaxID=3364669 RepID=UPI0036C9CFD0